MNHQTEDMLVWLRSLGFSPRTIRKYGLDNPYMTDLARDCMVRAAVREHSTLSREQRRRRQHATDGTSNQ